MHFFNFFFIVYVAVWILGGLIIAREALAHQSLVRGMAFLAIVVGPLGMLAYLGIRYIGQSIQTATLLRQHDGLHHLK